MKIGRRGRELGNPVELTRPLTLPERLETALPNITLSIVLLDCDGGSRIELPPCTEESGDHADWSGGEPAP